MPAGGVASSRISTRCSPSILPSDYDWLLVVDDDVVLPRGFLDEFVFLAERFDLSLAQPAHRHRSHAAWEVTRRRPFSVVRETGFVEIGPVTASMPARSTRCCRSPSCGSAGVSTATGRRSPARTDGASAWSMPRPSVTACV